MALDALLANSFLLFRHLEHHQDRTLGDTERCGGGPWASRYARQPGDSVYIGARQGNITAQRQYPTGFPWFRPPNTRSCIPATDGTFSVRSCVPSARIATEAESRGADDPATRGSYQLHRKHSSAPPDTGLCRTDTHHGGMSKIRGLDAGNALRRLYAGGVTVAARRPLTIDGVLVSRAEIRNVGTITLHRANGFYLEPYQKRAPSQALAGSCINASNMAEREIVRRHRQYRISFEPTWSCTRTFAAA